MFGLFKKQEPRLSHADVSRFIDNVLAHQSLKPCPFCGGHASIAYGMYDNGPQFEVLCNECDISTDANPEIAWAIEKWNRRYEPQIETSYNSTNAIK